MKIIVPLVYTLIEMGSEYEKFAVTRDSQAVLYMHVLITLYGMLVAVMLFYKKLKREHIGYGFKVIPYKLCVANKIVRGRQNTARSWLNHFNPSILEEQKFKCHSMKNYLHLLSKAPNQVRITRSPVIAYLTTRVQDPNEDDWKKLVRMINYLQQTKQDYLKLQAT